MTHLFESKSSNLHLTVCYYPFNHGTVNTSHYFTGIYTVWRLRFIKQKKALNWCSPESCAHVPWKDTFSLGYNKLQTIINALHVNANRVTD